MWNAMRIYVRAALVPFCSCVADPHLVCIPVSSPSCEMIATSAIMSFYLRLVIQGHRRLPLLFKGFEVVQWFGHSPSVLDEAPLWQWTNQPVIVLRKKVNEDNSSKV